MADITDRQRLVIDCPVRHCCAGASQQPRAGAGPLEEVEILVLQTKADQADIEAIAAFAIKPQRIGRPRSSHYFSGRPALTKAATCRSITAGSILKVMS